MCCASCIFIQWDLVVTLERQLILTFNEYPMFN